MHTAGMNKDFGKTGGPPCSNFPPHSLTKVDNAGPNCEPPAQITQTVLSGIEGERLDIIRLGRVTDEAPSCMSIKAEHEEESKMVGVPKGFETLVVDLVMGGGIHENHNQEHKVACNSAGLLVVDIQCDFRSNLYDKRIIVSMDRCCRKHGAYACAPR